MIMNKLVLATLLTLCMSAAQAGPFKFKFNGEGGPQSSTQRTTLVEDESGEIPEGGSNGGQSTTNVVNTGSTSAEVTTQAVSEPATLALLLAIPAVMVLRRRYAQ